MSQGAPLDDATVVELAVAGDEQAFGILVERYQRPVYGLILRMVKDHGLAEDLAQESFVKAWGALARYDAGHRMASWLFKIAHNTTIDHLRRRSVPTLSLTASEDGETDLSERLADAQALTPEQSVVANQLGQALEAALGGLRPEYREVMVLRFQEGLAYEEIAEVMALPLGTVKTHIHRARKEMASVMIAKGWSGVPAAP